MDDLTEVYNELIMEHSMNSYNKKKLENADYCEIGHNPNCGDEITLELKVKQIHCYLLHRSCLIILFYFPFLFPFLFILMAFIY